MFGLGFGEVVVILVIALLVFGPERLPELARTLGRTMAEFRRSMDEIRTEFRAPAQDFERSLHSPPPQSQINQNQTSNQISNQTSQPAPATVEPVKIPENNQ